MNKKRTLLIFLLAFILLIGGAYLLYQRLGQELDSDRLSAPLPPASTPTPSESAVPSSSPAPSESPASSNSPAPSDSPASSNSPAPSDSPASSNSPAPSDSPASSETPASSENPAPSESPDPQKILAPDITVYDVDGNEIHLSDFAGKPVVVNFWASWCGPCKSEMPDFEQKYQELGDEVYFLMVNATDGSRETVEKASQFISDQGYTFPVFYDIGLSAAATYGVYGFPSTFFIDAEGYAIAQATGAISAEILQRGIDMTRPSF